MKLLIVEDEEDLLRALIKGFRNKGYNVEGSSSGKEALELSLTNDYDLIILDLNLPEMDGFEVLKEVQKVKPLQKVLILSARFGYDQRIKGLDLGANDYLVKPFHFGELEARVRSLLRRNFLQNKVVLSFDKFYLDTKTRRLLTKRQEHINLSPKEYLILEYLLLNRDRTVSPEELIEHAWGDDNALFSNAIKVHISSLRKKLSSYSNENLICNVRGLGYCLVDALSDVQLKES